VTDLGDWQPLTLVQTADLLRGFDRHWWIAGGWAIDLFLGRQTREHADVEISVLRADQTRLREHLTGWDIHVAHDGSLTPWDGAALTAPRHQFWARPASESPWALEILLEDHAPDRWLYRRDHRMWLPLERFGRVNADALPYVCPEVALLFKSRAPNLERNAVDFATAGPFLDDPARLWLREALELTSPGHPWTERLAGTATM
jgi:hypothetical protein